MATERIAGRIDKCTHPRRSRFMSPSEALLDLFDRLSCGALLLDSKRGVVGFNDTAQTHLQELCREYGEPTGDDGWARELLHQLEQITTYRRGLPVPARRINRRGGGGGRSSPTFGRFRCRRMIVLRRCSFLSILSDRLNRGRPR